MNRTGITMLLALVSFPCRISYQADYSKYDVNGEQLDCRSKRHNYTLQLENCC